MQAVPLLGVAYLSLIAGAVVVGARLVIGGRSQTRLWAPVALLGWRPSRRIRRAASVRQAARSSPRLENGREWGADHQCQRPRAQGDESCGR
jgi:hypothetical protein